MSTLNELKFDALETLTGLSGRTLNELEYAWLLDATGETGGTLNELRMIFLADQGQTTGTINERWFAYLGDEGYSGSLGERFYQFWSAGGPALGGFNYLFLESGDDLLLESGDNLLLESGMASAKVSELDELADEPANDDEFYINDGGTSKRITWSVIKAGLQ